MGGHNTKGDANERKLVTALDDDGWAVMRAPASGSATERELPDVLIGNGDNFYAIEAKSSGGDPVYIDGKEITDLYYFAMNFGAQTKIAVRFDAVRGDPHWGTDEIDKWRFFDPDDLHQTDGGNYRVKKETALSEGETADAL